MKHLIKQHLPQFAPFPRLFRRVVFAILISALFAQAENASEQLPLKVFENLNAGRHQTVIVYGTSVSIWGEWANALKNYFETAYPAQVTFLNTAESGRQSNWGVENLKERVLDHHPDLVFLEFAINDAATKHGISIGDCEKNLDTMVKVLGEKNPDIDIVLQTMNPAWDSPVSLPKKYANDRPKLEDYYEVYRRYAREHGLPLVDNYPNWNRILQEEPVRYHTMVPDGIHPNKEASLDVAWPVIRALLERARQAASTVALWPEGKMPGQGAQNPEMDLPSRGDGVQRITNISHPTLTMFPVHGEHSPLPAMIVCPGGAYSYVAYTREGSEVAGWLNSIGINALVLKYRVPDNRAGALRDIQRALSLAHMNASKWNIDPDRIGVIGFSAGGNLCAKASNLFDARAYEAIDDVDKLSCRPDVAVLVYPAYLEKDGKIAGDLNLKANIPPTLIVHNEDDKSFITGTRLYVDALEQADHPYKFLCYPTGGHGYGLNSNGDARTWPVDAAKWLRRTGITRSVHVRNTQGTGTVNIAFDFSRTPAAKGKTHVDPDILYSKDRGFGFESGVELKQTDWSITSEKPFIFHIAVPREGNYRVTVTFGDSVSPTDNTVFAELRRLMLEHVHTEPGATVAKTFVVNTRTPAIPGGGQVKINQRERTLEQWAWDDRLSLEFNGGRPGISSIQIETADVPTVYLLGDSTVCDQASEPYNSWGQMITAFLKPDIAVANGAESGDSIAPSLNAGRFAKFWKQMKQGDYLFIQYGHNDMKSKAPDALETFTDNMRHVVDETLSHGGTPVLVTSVSRRTFGPDGKIINSFGGYTDAVRTVAREKGCSLIDLQVSSAVFYEALGEEKSHVAFATMQEGTHHNNYGSYEIAKCVIMGIRQANLDMVKYIADDFRGFNPSQPDPVEDFKLPHSTRVIKPEKWPTYPKVSALRDNQPWTPSQFAGLNPELPTLILAGDSTADKGPDSWHRGWGAVLKDYFDRDKINVVNRARGGRSFRSFLREGLWDELVAAIKPGDYVLIQFGHNDGGDINAPNGRPDLPGLGYETRVVKRPDGSEEKVLTFGAYARKYVKDVRDRGATPILLSTTATSRWDANGCFILQPGDQPHWMYKGIREIAKDENVLFLDHKAAISDRYTYIGETITRSFFAADWVHTTTVGAMVNAEMFISVLKSVPEFPLNGYLNKKGKRIPAWNSDKSISVNITGD